MSAKSESRVVAGASWMAYAACATDTTQGLPWTTDVAQTPTVLAELMVETCTSCPVRLACAAYATQAGVTGGWWAGIDRDPHTNEGADLSVQLMLPLDLDGAA